MPCLYGKINTGVAFLTPPHHHHRRHPPPICSGCNTCSNDPGDRIRQLLDISIQGPEARSKNSDAAPFPLPPHTHAHTEPVSRQTKHRLNPLATHQSPPENPQTSRHNLVLHQHKLEVSSDSGAQVSWPQGVWGWWVGGLVEVGVGGLEIWALKHGRRRKVRPCASDPALHLFARSTFSEKHLFLELYCL